MPPLPRILALCLLISLIGSPGDAAEFLRRFTPADRTFVTAVAVDAAGNVFAAGITERAAAIPRSVRIGPVGASEGNSAAQDVFVLKLSARGAMLGAAVIGGRGPDDVTKLAIDPRGGVVLLGTSASTDFPAGGSIAGATVPAIAGLRYVLVARLDASGTNLLSTRFLGGSGYENPAALAVDAQGRIVLAGLSGSSTFPESSGLPILSAFDIRSHVTGLAADDLTVSYVRDLSNGAAWDAIRSMAADADGNVFLTGLSQSLGFSTTNALQGLLPVFNSGRAFLTKLNSAGAVLFSTFIAGDDFDTGEAVALADAGRRVLVAGRTRSKQFPAGTWPEPGTGGTLGVARGFLLEFDPAGQAIEQTNFFAFGMSSEVSGVVTLPDGRSVMAGTADAGFWPLLSTAPFLATVGPSGVSSVWLDPLHPDASASFRGLAVDSVGNVVTCGTEVNGGQSGGSFIARYSPADLSRPPEPKVRLLSPTATQRYVPNSDISLRAIVAGTTGPVTSVTFLTGRRTIGVVTDPALSLVWSNVARGVYNLMAVAELDGISVTSRPVRVTVGSPRNDRFDRRIRMTGSTFAVEGNTAAATAEPGEPSDGSRSVWYSWTAPADGVFELLLEPDDRGSWSLAGSLYTGPGLGRLESAGSLAQQRPSSIKARRGIEYLIRISSYDYGSQNDSFRLRLKPTIAPANDDFDRAIALAGDAVSRRSSVRHATLESFEGTYLGNSSGSVWYSWTPTTSGLFLISTSSDGLNSAGAVRVFVGGTVSNLQSVGTYVTGLTNGQYFQAEAGAEHRIAVIGYNADDVDWNVDRIVPPVNDAFAQRLTIPPGITSVTGTIIGATVELGETNGFFGSPPSVWWAWRPPTPGVYQVLVRPIVRAVSPSGQTPARQLWPGSDVLVYEGDELGALNLVSGSSGNFGSGRLQFRASPETNYSIAVRRSDSLFALDILPVNGPSNDNYEQADLVEGAFVGLHGSLTGATLQVGEANPNPILNPIPNPVPNPIPIPIPRPNLFAGPIGTFPRAPQVSVWYRWTAPADGDYSIWLNVGSVGVYRGETLSGSSTLVPMAPRLLLKATAGTEYRLRVVGEADFTLRIRPANRADNDDFANREILTGLPVRFYPRGFDATSEPGEPSHWPGYGLNESVWYTWTAPVTASCLVTSSVPVAVYTGNAVSNLVSVAGGPGPGGFEFLAVAGTTYQIAVNLGYYFNYPQGLGAGLELRVETPPTNDDFADRIPLRGRIAEVVGSNVGATREAHEPPIGPNASTRTVWWTWRAPATGRAAFSVGAINPANWSWFFGGALAVFTGESVSQLTSLSDTNSWIGSVNVPVEAGRDYHVAVDSGTTAASGPFRLQVQFWPKAVNDDFVHRRPFVNAVQGTFGGASLEPGESTDFWIGEAGTLWWSWTPRTTGVYDFSVETEDANGLPGLLGVALDLYTGDALNALEPVGHVLESGQVNLRFSATGGVRYAVRLAGSAHQFSLRVFYRPPPANDAFARRIVLRGANISTTGSNLTATVETGEPDSEPGTKSVWWSWTAPARGSVRLVAGNSVCQLVRVYTGTTLATLTSLATGDFGSVTFVTEPGQTYQFSISPQPCWPPDAEPFPVSLVLHRPPVNDDFARRTRLSGGAVLLTNATVLGAGLEEGEPISTFVMDASVWWVWAAPESGRYTVEVVSPESTIGLALFTGNTLTGLTRVAASGPALQAVNAGFAAGTEVAIMAGGPMDSIPERFHLRIRRTAKPANDDFADRIEFQGERMTSTLEGSSVEDAEPWASFDEMGTSVWWRYTPTNDGWHEFTLTTEAAPLLGRANLSVLRGDVLLNLPWENPRRTRQLPSLYKYYYLLEAGVPYAFRVGGQEGWFGPVELGLRFIPKAVNDHFTNALEVVGANAILSSSNTLCTVEPFEPRHRNAWENSVWWRWIAPTTGVYSITRSNSPVWSYVDVYVGTAVSDLTRVTETAYGREFGEYLLRAEAGVAYSIAATTYGDIEGLIRLRLLPANPPANDDFADRAVLNGSHVSSVGTTIDATAEPNDPVAGYLGQQTVWWRWTAPAVGPVTVNVQADAGSFRGGIYRGTDLETLVPVVEPGLQWPLEFVAEAGVEYSIGLTPWSNFAGLFTLTLDGPEAAAPSPASMGSRGPGAGPMMLLRPPGPERAWVIETSTNLIDWLSVATNAVGSAGFLIEPKPSDRSRFFRNR